MTGAVLDHLWVLDAARWLAVRPSILDEGSEQQLGVPAAGCGPWYRPVLAAANGGTSTRGPGAGTCSRKRPILSRNTRALASAAVVCVPTRENRPR